MHLKDEMGQVKTQIQDKVMKEALFEMEKQMLSKQIEQLQSEKTQLSQTLASRPTHTADLETQLDLQKTKLEVNRLETELHQREKSYSEHLLEVATSH